MIKFKEVTYSEYYAMRELYNELVGDNKKFEVISKSYLPGILKGNSVVVEKFTSVTKVFGRDRYRMYIRVGSKAKMPDEVRLPKSYQDKSIPLSFKVETGVKKDNTQQNNQSDQSQSSGFRFNIQTLESKILGDAITYNKKERLLVLELDSIRDAAKALNVLPFGLGYKIYLLD